MTDDWQVVEAGIRIHPDEPTDVMVTLERNALAALARLREREAQLERERDTFKRGVNENADMVDEQRIRAEAAAACVAEAERERDNAIYERDLHVAAGVAAEAEVSRLREREAQLETPAWDRLAAKEVKRLEARVARLEEALLWVNENYPKVMREMPSAIFQPLTALAHEEEASGT